MQITSAHWQLFCCYLLWYSVSSSFRDLIDARPESIYIPGSWEHRINTDCTQPSFARELTVHHLKPTPARSRSHCASLLFPAQLCKPADTFRRDSWSPVLNVTAWGSQAMIASVWWHMQKTTPHDIKWKEGKENINHRHPAHFGNLRLSFTLNLEYKRVNYREIIHN